MNRRLIPILVLTLGLQACASAPPGAPLLEARQKEEERAQERFRSGDLAEAASHFERAVTLAEMAADQGSVIANLLNLGTALMLMGDYERARPVLERSESEARALGRHDLEARALSALGELAYRNGDPAAARNRYRQLLSDPDLAKSPALRSAALNGLFLLEMRANRLETAERHLEQAERQMDALTEVGRSAVLLNRATLELRRGRYAASVATAEQALAIDRAAAYSPGIAADLELLGECYRRMGETDKARLYLRQALTLYERMGQRPQAERLQEAVESLSP
ncbi:MAG: hypothetical protein Kow006_08820 [Gammaproteobacteria bacterium]